jgi:hypothetical protein
LRVDLLPGEGEAMTEHEWRRCTDPERLWRFCKGRLSPRKARLFVVACCRQMESQLADERLRAALGVAERHADGLTQRGELRAAQTQVEAALAELQGFDHQRLSAVRWAVARHPRVAEVLKGAMLVKGVIIDLFFSTKAQLLRDLAGDPFGPVAIDTAWLAWHDGVIPRLAQAVYDERAFERLPILADALEEVGCADPTILGHLRGPGPHVRGCWVVDLLLGK